MTDHDGRRAIQDLRYRIETALSAYTEALAFNRQVDAHGLALLLREAQEALARADTNSTGQNT